MYKDTFRLSLQGMAATRSEQDKDAAPTHWHGINRYTHANFYTIINNLWKIMFKLLFPITLHNYIKPGLYFIYIKKAKHRPRWTKTIEVVA